MTVYSLDSDAARARLRQAAGLLAAAHPEIEEVRLVGSLARGEAGPASDADLLVLLSRSDEPFAERVGRLLGDWPAVGIAVDLLPLTRAEFERRLAEGDPFARRLDGESERLWGDRAR